MQFAVRLHRARWRLCGAYNDGCAALSKDYALVRKLAPGSDQPDGQGGIERKAADAPSERVPILRRGGESEMSTTTAAATRASGTARPSAFTAGLSAVCRDLANRTACFLRDLHTACFDPYRPERHYMRGPGPRYRAKLGALGVRLAGG